MSQFIELHPVLFTILAFPCVVTACIAVLLVCVVLVAQFVEVRWSKRQ